MFRQIKQVFSRYRLGVVVIFICLLGVYLVRRNTDLSLWRSTSNVLLEQHQQSWTRNQTFEQHSNWTTVSTDSEDTKNRTSSSKNTTSPEKQTSTLSENEILKFFNKNFPVFIPVENNPPLTDGNIQIVTIPETLTPIKPEEPLIISSPQENPILEEKIEENPNPLPAVDDSPPTKKPSPTETTINPHNYNYMIQNENKCKNSDGSDREIFFIIFVTSIHTQYDRRKAIRNTWGKEKLIGGKNTELIFVLAKKDDKKLQDLLIDEAKMYGDIIQEDFIDAYRNLTLKTMFIMKWITENCQNAEFVMKTDDDMYIQVPSLVEFLKHQSKSSFMSGQVVNGKPIRNTKSKWYMPKTSYTRDKYPPFCAGPGYVFSTDMASKILNISYKLPYLYLEDVYVALCNEALHIIPVNNKNFHNSLVKFRVCDYKRMFSSHRVKPEQMYSFYKQITNSHTKC